MLPEAASEQARVTRDRSWSCQTTARPVDFNDMPEIVTPGELARELGISPKTLRAWLRAGRDAGYPLLAGHEHYGRSEFTRKEARQLIAEYRRTRGGTTPVGHDSASGHTRTTHAPVDRN